MSKIGGSMMSAGFDIPGYIHRLSTIEDIDLRRMDLRSEWFKENRIAYVGVMAKGLGLRDFRIAECRSTDFYGSDMRDAYLWTSRSFNRCGFERANLQGTSLRTYFEDCNFDNADLRWCNASDAEVLNSSFIGCDFRKADLRRAKLSGNVKHADFMDADLRGANVKMTDIPREQLQSAFWDVSTAIPNRMYGYKPEKVKC